MVLRDKRPFWYVNHLKLTSQRTSVGRQVRQHRLWASGHYFLRCIRIGPHNQLMACVRVHSLAVCMAAGSSSFHLCATSFANGSSGFGAPSKACIERSIVLICSAGDQLPGYCQLSCAQLRISSTNSSEHLGKFGLIYRCLGDISWSGSVSSEES
jgi:hypothetical protein